MNKDLPLRVAGVIFIIIAIAHLLRLIFQLHILVGNVVIPMWASWVALIVPLVLAVWMFRATKT